MPERDIYQEVLDMINRDDVVGLPNTPAMKRVLELQMTPREAEMALKIGLTGGTLEEMAQKVGMEKEKFRQKVNTMADKGAMWIDPGNLDNPNCRVLPSSAPGFIETGIWGNVRYPYDVELATNLHQAVVEWSRDKLCTLGFPFAPVWAHPWILPADAKREENLAEVLREREYFSLSFCPCRLSHWIAEPGNHCQHMLETCLHTGDTARWCVEHKQGREITYDEAMELLKKSNADGLVHTIDINGFICNCCNDCCPIFIGFRQFHTRTLIPSPFIPRVDEGECVACGDCAGWCPVGAITVEEIARIDPETCIGCGVCVTHCPSEAMALTRRAEQVEISDELKQQMDEHGKPKA